VIIDIASNTAVLVIVIASFVKRISTFIFIDTVCFYHNIDNAPLARHVITIGVVGNATAAAAAAAAVIVIAMLSNAMVCRTKQKYRKKIVSHAILPFYFSLLLSDLTHRAICDFSFVHNCVVVFSTIRDTAIS